jgi:release factor glutamine methyltransferase
VLAAERRLAAAGCPTPAADAEALAAESAAVAGDAALERFEALVARRAAREPLAYLLGRETFRGLELRVDSRVLVPRPHTEALVEAGLSVPRGARVLDLCTGSGAVALALAHERPDLRVSGIDISGDALAVARDNGDRLGLEVSWLESDLLLGAPGPWDAVLANAPYIAGRDEHGLAREMIDHEPPGAFRGGRRDGLDVVRRLIAQASGVPWLALEVGDAHAAEVGELLAQAGFGEVMTRTDFTGVERVVVGRREGHEASRSRLPGDGLAMGLESTTA